MVCFWVYWQFCEQCRCFPGYKSTFLTLAFRALVFIYFVLLMLWTYSVLSFLLLAETFLDVKNHTHVCAEGDIYFPLYLSMWVHWVSFRFVFLSLHKPEETLQLYPLNNVEADYLAAPPHVTVSSLLFSFPSTLIFWGSSLHPDNGRQMLCTWWKLKVPGRDFSWTLCPTCSLSLLHRVGPVYPKAICLSFLAYTSHWHSTSMH